MSQELINHSQDLTRLRNEGYTIEIVSGFLLVRDIPYVNSKKEVHHGLLVSSLTLNGKVATTPSDHVMHFAGEHPCHKDGTEIIQIKHQTQTRTHVDGVITNHSFSAKPPEGFKDYHHKVTTYINIISGPAEAIDPEATAKKFAPVIPSEEGYIFNYVDTLSSRAGITDITKKLESNKIGIIGLGGTGSYILDLLAKVPVREIHLFDGDKFSNHNAFRSPGAPSIDELEEIPSKVDYMKEKYSPMHRGIISHSCFVDEENVEELKNFDFLFLSIDNGNSKEMIIKNLVEWGISFIDVGMGINLLDNDSLSGVLRVTTSTSEKRDHINSRIPFADGADNAYDQNIQIAELNALNAALAVIKWKKMCGFYQDFEMEFSSFYTIDGNHLLNQGT